MTWSYVRIAQIIYLLAGEARKRYFVTCTLFPLLWYEIKDVPIYRCKSFKFRTLGVKFRYIYWTCKKNTKRTLKLQKAKLLEGRKCRNLLAINHTALLYEKKSLLNV